MMREIKFRAWDGKVMHNAEDVCIIGLDVAIDNGEMDWSFDFRKLTLMQYTGLKDCNGVEIYGDDTLNICYEKDGFIFDGNYSVSISETGVKFNFLDLAWSDNGHNQYPLSPTLNVSDYGLVRRDYRGEWDDCGLCISEQDGYKYSNIFKVIGNIHENPEFLEGKQ